MRKVGFTLVEIAIVLMVLGVIMGMVIKSRALTYSTSVRSEISKINKISIAVDLFYTDLRRMPEYKTSTAVNEINVEELIAMEYLTKTDFESAFSSNTWTLHDNISFASVVYGAYYIVAQDNGTDPTRVVGVRNEKLEARFICSFENLADDGEAFLKNEKAKSLINGRGRLFRITGSNNNLYNNYDTLLVDAKNCSSIGDDYEGDYLFEIYAF